MMLNFQAYTHKHSTADFFSWALCVCGKRDTQMRVVNESCENWNQKLVNLKNVSTESCAQFQRKRFLINQAGSQFIFNLTLFSSIQPSACFYASHVFSEL